VPLYDFKCLSCHHEFESLVSDANSNPEICPLCAHSDLQRLIVRFKIGGQGDLRESTMYHGCHSPLPEGAPSGHTHTANCGHTKKPAK